MLISLQEALTFGETHNCGIAAVNTPTLESLVASIEVAETYQIPFIVQHAQVHEQVNSIENIGPAMATLAEQSTAPIVVHIDHAETFDYVKRGFAVGFNSAMFDGSRLPYEENLRITKEVVKLANEKGFAVEAELGVMPGREDGVDSNTGVGDESLYTEPDLAESFVKETGVDALACSFGTVHGLYKTAPKLNYALIQTLRQRTGVPIVMHGGSGLSPEEYRKCIEYGVGKINYYTYADRQAFKGVQEYLANNPDTYLFADLAIAARDGFKKNIDALVRVLYENVIK